MVHELTKTEHDGLAVGDRVYLASDGKQRAGLRYGTLVDIHRDTPRGHFWYRVEWDGGQHHKARAVLTRQEIVKLVDTRASKPSRPTITELKAENAKLRGQLAEAEAIVDQRQQLIATWQTKAREAQATIEKVREHLVAIANGPTITIDGLDTNYDAKRWSKRALSLLSAPSSTGSTETTRDDENAKYFHDGWVAALREVRLRSDRQIGEFLVEQLGDPSSTEGNDHE